jgi:hypothetical protein
MTDLSGLRSIHSRLAVADARAAEANQALVTVLRTGLMNGGTPQWVDDVLRARVETTRTEWEQLATEAKGLLR